MGLFRKNKVQPDDVANLSEAEQMVRMIDSLPKPVHVPSGDFRATFRRWPMGLQIASRPGLSPAGAG